MKIGILKTGHVPEALAGRFPDYDGMFRDLLAGAGFSFETFDVEAGQLPATPEACDGWLITGSACGVYEDHPWIAPLEAFIRASRAAGVRMAGVCFGHQIMARAFGARVEKHPGGWCLGPFDYEFREPAETLTAMAFHQDQVMELPAGARLIATADACRFAGLAYDGWGWSVQPHPEFDAAYVTALLDHYDGRFPPAPVARARANMARPLAKARLAARLAAHLKGPGTAPEEAVPQNGQGQA